MSERVGAALTGTDDANMAYISTWREELTERFERALCQSVDVYKSHDFSMDSAFGEYDARLGVVYAGDARLYH